MAEDGGEPVIEQGFEAVDHYFDSSFLNSESFTFFVGPKREKYVVHKDIFSKQSPMLGDMMDNNAAAAPLAFDDIEEVVFQCLCDYIYAGFLRTFGYDPDTSTECQHYPTMAQHGHRALVVHGKGAPSHTFQLENSAAYGNCQASNVTCSCEVKICQTPPCHEFSTFTHFTCKYYETAFKDFGPAPKWAKPSPDAVQVSDDCSNALLWYATLYMLSGRFKVKGLKLLALRCLHVVLSTFPVVWRRIPDLIPLIRFIYAKTPDGDPLRRMVAYYTATLKERLMLHPEFNKLLREQTDFCHEVLQCSAEYSGIEKELRHKH
ncbi:hypothetical protein PG984_005765 [Apiospora sp. TS-2023a]